MLDHLPILLLFTMFHPLWWILVILASVIIVYALDDDRGALASTTAIITFVALALFSDMPILHWIVSNPLNLLIYIGLYLVGGGLWGLIKWYLFAANRRDRYEDMKREWLKDKSVVGTEIPESLKDEWKKFLLGQHEWSEDTGEWVETEEPQRKNESDYDYRNRTYNSRKPVRRLKLIPVAWEHKALILTWMTYWPWSFLWTVTNDFIRKAFKRIQRALSDLMDRIARFVFRDTAKDFKQS